MGSRSPLGYVYEVNTGRYRDTRTGRFQSSEAVETVMQQRIDLGTERLKNYLAAAQDPDSHYTMTDWRNAMAVELRNMHVQIAALGAGGTTQLTADDWTKVQDRLRFEYEHLDGFLADIQAGKLSPAQIELRMGMYPDGVWSTYWKTRESAMQNAGATHEEWVLDFLAEHCEDCEEFAREGKQALGHFPACGDGHTKCLNRCRCHKRYYRKVGNTYRNVA